MLAVAKVPSLSPSRYPLPLSPYHGPAPPLLQHRYPLLSPYQRSGISLLQPPYPPTSAPVSSYYSTPIPYHSPATP